MVLNPQQANKAIPLISDLEAYSSFLDMLEILKEKYYTELRDSRDGVTTHQLQGKLQLVDELKELRDRVKDSLNGANS
jgi:hypothetical protein